MVDIFRKKISPGGAIMLKRNKNFSLTPLTMDASTQSHFKGTFETGEMSVGVSDL